MMILIITKC